MIAINPFLGYSYFSMLGFFSKWWLIENPTRNHLLSAFLGVFLIWELRLRRGLLLQFHTQWQWGIWLSTLLGSICLCWLLSSKGHQIMFASNSLSRLTSLFPPPGNPFFGPFLFQTPCRSWGLFFSSVSHISLPRTRLNDLPFTLFLMCDASYIPPALGPYHFVPRAPHLGASSPPGFSHAPSTCPLMPAFFTLVVLCCSLASLSAHTLLSASGLFLMASFPSRAQFSQHFLLLSSLFGLICPRAFSYSQ